MANVQGKKGSHRRKGEGQVRLAQKTRLNPLEDPCRGESRGAPKYCKKDKKRGHVLNQRGKLPWTKEGGNKSGILFSFIK